jgi:hypothetical protein
VGLRLADLAADPWGATIVGGVISGLAAGGRWSGGEEWLPSRPSAADVMRDAVVTGLETTTSPTEALDAAEGEKGRPDVESPA